jgi:YesN/AraC family two-component response regulator
METTQNSYPAFSLLVVDDDKMAREVLSLMIARKFPDSSIYFADNGRTGVELFKEHTPDIVITDISMPVMDGLQMADVIKAMKDDTKFIVLTGYSEMDYLSKLTEFGIKECILKPIVFKRLFAAIENCIDEIHPDRK